MPKDRQAADALLIKAMNELRDLRREVAQQRADRAPFIARSRAMRKASTRFQVGSQYGT